MCVSVEESEESRICDCVCVRQVGMCVPVDECEDSRTQCRVFVFDRFGMCQ